VKVVQVVVMLIMMEKQFPLVVVLVEKHHNQHRKEAQELVEKDQLMLEEIRVQLVQR
tara:strand:+ start:309 stop:479 length:171 start_codon:yes stop_codon:yes gene_type:complete